MNFKKILACLLATLMCITLLAACDSEDPENSSDTLGTTDTSESSETESSSESESGDSPEAERFDYFGTNLTEYVTVDSSLYHGLSATLSSEYIIDEDDVRNYVNSQLIDHKTPLNDGAQVTDTAIGLGDSAFIYYKGFLDGVEFSGGSNWDDEEPTELVIGSGEFIPGFEDGLIGIVPSTTSAEEPYALHVTFPESYSEELAGKAVVFNVWIAYSIDYELPEYNAEFITDTLGYEAENEDVVGDYESYVLNMLSEEMATYEESAVLNIIWDELLAGATVHQYPESEIEYYYNSYIDQYEYYMEMYTYYGYSFETLDEFVIAYLGLDSDADWKEETREACKIDVAQNLIFHCIGQNEGIIITDADYQESIQYYVDYYTAYGYSYSAEDIEAGLGSDFLKEHALFQKVNTLLLENCTVTYAD